MKWALIMALMGIFVSCQSQSQSFVWVAGNIPSGSQPTSVSCPGPSTCFVVGQNGLILLTQNGGLTYTPLDFVNGGFALANFNLTSISCPSTLICYIVGNQGLIAQTLDGGSTFQITNETVNGNLTLNSVACQTVTTPACVAVGSNNSMYVLPILAGAWAPVLNSQSSGVGPANYGQVALSGSTILISAQTTTGQGVPGLVVSSDGGVTFQFSPISQTEAPQGISGVACQLSGTCIAVGPGAVLQGQLSVLSWYPVVIPQNVSQQEEFLEEVFPDPSGSFWLTGSSGTLVYLSNGLSQTSTGNALWTFEPQTLPGSGIADTVGSVGCSGDYSCISAVYSLSENGAAYETGAQISGQSGLQVQ
ncbi:MAG: beta propeller repeat protein [Leptospirillum sp.]